MKRILTLIILVLSVCLCMGQVPSTAGLTKTQANALAGRWRLFGLSGFADVTTGTQGYANSGYTYTITAPTIAPTLGTIYKDSNNVQYTVIAYASLKLYVYQATITGTPPASGSLTKVGNGTGDTSLTYSAVVVGTGQNNCTDRVQWTQQCTVTDPFWLFGNGYWTASQFLGVGNPLTIKPYLEIFGNRIPIILPSATTSALTTAIQTAANTSTTVTTTVTTSNYLTVGTTAYWLQGCVIKDASVGTSTTIKSIVDATHVVVSAAVSWNSGDTVNVTSWPGSGYTIPDGGMVWSQHITGLELLAGTAYQMVTYQQVAAQQIIAKQYSYTYLNTQRSSDTVWGGTLDGGDYTNLTSVIPGYATSAAFYYGPIMGVGRQLPGTYKACTLGVGDSIMWGNGNNPFAGMIGTAINAQAGSYELNGGLGGATVGNLIRLGGGNIFSLAQWCDHVAVSVGTNDTANNETPSQVEGYMITFAQLLTQFGADISFCSIPPRSASSSDNYQTYANQVPSTYNPWNEAINNWFRDTSANGAAVAMAAAGVNYSGYFMDIDQAIEKSSSGATPTFTATTYTFTITAPTTTPSFLATYTDSNGNSYTVGPSIAGETVLYTTILSPGTCPASGTLTKTFGTGDSTLTYSAVTISSANQEMFGTGGYWIVNGTSNYATSDGTHPSLNINSVAAPYITGTGNPFANLMSTIATSIHP
jgi:hypothetical protein